MTTLSIRHRSAMIRSMPTVSSIAMALLLSSGVAFAAQFRAADHALPWPSADGSGSLVPANAATNGWTNPALVGGGVSFTTTTNGVPTPLWFGDEATGTVAYAALVVDCTIAPTAWSTLLDSSTPLRMNPTAFAWQNPGFSTNGVSVAVDTETDGVISADEERHLVEVCFSESVILSDLVLGGHPATPAWNRSWPGRVFEAVFLDASPAEGDLTALRAYLSIKWDIGLGISAPDDARSRLQALGVKSDPLFSSILLMR